MTYSTPIQCAGRRIRSYLPVLLILLSFQSLKAQLAITTAGQTYTIDFDSTLTGVNDSSFASKGFAPTPAAGQLDSDAWACVARTNTSVEFGGSSAGIPQMNYGVVSSGGVSKQDGGVYAFEVASGDIALGANPSPNDFTDTYGSFTLAVVNNSGGAVSGVNLAYELHTFNDQADVTTVDFAYRYGGLEDTVAALSVTSPLAAAATPVSWQMTPYSTSLSVNMAAGDTIYLRWYIGGTGNNSDEIALDDISISMDATSYTYNGAAWSPADPSGFSGGTDTLYVTSGSASLTASTAVAYVEVAAGASLEINGTLSVTDSLKIMADASGYGQVLGDVSGTAIWESYLNASSASRWFNVGIPLNATLADISFSNGAFFQSLNEVGGDTSKVNIWWYNSDKTDASTGEGSWTPVASLSALTDTAGYSVYLGAPYFGSLPTTMRVNGTLNNDVINQAISVANGGWNFIANPYASALDWTQLCLDNALLNQNYYVYEDDNSAWLGYNAAVGVPDVTQVPGISITEVTQHIAPGQAIFVNATGIMSSLAFANTQRTLLSNPPLYHQQPLPGLFLVVTTADGHSDYTYVGLSAAASDSRDLELDGVKKMNLTPEVPNLYTKLYGEAYMYNFISDQFSARTVPLSLEVKAGTDYQITAIMKGDAQNWQVELEDSHQQKVDLGKGAVSYQAGANNGEFLLHLNQAGVSLTEEKLQNLFAYSEGGDIVVKHPDFDNAEPLLISLYDAAGKLVDQQQASAAERTRLHGHMSKAGFYILQISQEGRIIYTQKLTY